MENLFPDILRNSEDFQVFVKLASKELGDIKNAIEILQTLSNADRTPQEFLKSLGDIISYNYVDSYDDEIQRECLKYYWNQSNKDVGTKKALQMMATYGSNEGYLGGDLFLPGTFRQMTEAIVVLPREYLFCWSKSTWSGEDKRPGPIIYKEGTILIEVRELNQVIRDRVESVKPAGMQIVYRYIKEDGTEEIITNLK